MFLWLNDQNSMYLRTYASNLTSNKMHVLNCVVIMIFRQVENISSCIMIIYMIAFFDKFEHFEKIQNASPTLVYLFMFHKIYDIVSQTRSDKSVCNPCSID